MRPRAEVHALLGAYTLEGAVRPRGGAAGERLGLSTGSSVEFHDRRSFQPGDDLRRLDWRALARTDKMLTRQYREEVSPVLELVVDASESMAFLDDKHQLTVDLLALLVELARAGGWRARAHLVDARGRRPVALDALLAEGITLDGAGPWPEAAAAVGAGLAPGSLVVVLSDLLFPSPPSQWLPALAGRAGQLAVVQVLGGEDLDPPEGPWRLTDAETGEILERHVDAAAIAAYHARLDALGQATREACARARALYASVRADASLSEVARGLAVAGLLTPRGVASGPVGG